jgi:hypothetical protein
MPMLELLKTHTHQGAVYRPGARIEVAEATARWLLARGIARLGRRHRNRPSRLPSPNVPRKRPGLGAAARRRRRPRPRTPTDC